MSFGKLWDADGLVFDASTLSFVSFALSLLLSISESFVVMFHCGSSSALLLFSGAGASVGGLLGDGVASLTDTLPSVDGSGVAASGIWSAKVSSGVGDSDSLLRGASERRWVRLGTCAKSTIICG